MPPDSPNPVQHGLLSFALCQVLSESAEPLTYMELVQQIHAKYRSWGRNYPTPLIEGKDRNREVLGDTEHRERVRFALRGNRQNGWSVEAGQIHGLTANSILAIYSPTSKTGKNKPLGYAKVRPNDLKMLKAGVEPIAHGQLPALQEFPEDARCELVAFGDFRLKLAADPLTQAGEQLKGDERQKLTEQIKKLDSDESLVRVLSSPAGAQWLLRMDSRENNKLYLVPASGLPSYVTSTSAHGNGQDRGPPSLKDLPSTFGPVPAGDKMVPWLSDSMGKIARVENLLRVVGEASRDKTSRGQPSVNVALELVLLRDDKDKAGEPILSGSQGILLHSGDWVGFRVKNEGKEAVDVNFLYVDAGFGIEPHFPKSISVDNRMQPGGKPLLFRAHVTSDNMLNVENVVLIAVRAPAGIAPYANFSFLAQPMLGQARSGLGDTASRGFESSLGRLLRTATYGDRGGPKTLTFEDEDEEQFACKIITGKSIHDHGRSGQKAIMAPSLPGTKNDSLLTNRARSWRGRTRRGTNRPPGHFENGLARRVVIYKSLIRNNLRQKQTPSWPLFPTH